MQTEVSGACPRTEAYISGSQAYIHPSASRLQLAVIDQGKALHPHTRTAVDVSLIMSAKPGNALSTAAAESAPDYGALYLNVQFSDLCLIVKEDVAPVEVAGEIEQPPCKRLRVSPCADAHADVRCALLTVSSPHKTVRLILSTRQPGGTEATATRIPGHKVVLWGRSGFFRSKVKPGIGCKARTGRKALHTQATCSLIPVRLACIQLARLESLSLTQLLPHSCTRLTTGWMHQARQKSSLLFLLDKPRLAAYCSRPSITHAWT